MDFAEHQAARQILSDQGNHSDNGQEEHDGGPDDQVIVIDGRHPSHGDPPFGLQTVRQAIRSTAS
jgi:hypothetical protein